MASSGALEADLGEYEQHNDHHQRRLASSPIAQYFYLVLEALDELGETEAKGDLGGGIEGFGRQALERRCRGIWAAQGTAPAVERWVQLLRTAGGGTVG